ncbi:MAG: glutaredoxin family protein [bacterium]
MTLLSRKKVKAKVEIFSKPDCHLCDEAKAVIKKVQGQWPFVLEEVDITKDKHLFEKYKEQIPVIFINGRKAFKFRVEENEFKKKLKRVS